MFSKLKSIVLNAATSFGTYKVLQGISSNVPKILVFHRFDRYGVEGRLSSDVFEKQVIELKNRFNVIPLVDLVNIIKGDQPMVKNAIVLTVDDGYHDFYDFAYPILKKYDMPATVYVTSDFIDRKIWLWPDRLTYALLTTTHEKYIFREGNKDVTYFLADENYYGRLWHQLVDYCLSIPNQEKLTFIREFEHELGVEPPSIPPSDFSAMSWEELRKMSVNGIEVGAHTCTHPSLSKVTDEELSYEIGGCKKRLEENLGIEVSNFCYPNGTLNDYNVKVMREVEAAGFRSATVCFADSIPYTNLYDIRRYGVGANMAQFRKVIYGVELLQSRLTKSSH